jgi:hypothetical protein
MSLLGPISLIGETSIIRRVDWLANFVPFSCLAYPKQGARPFPIFAARMSFDHHMPQAQKSIGTLFSLLSAMEV